MSLVKNYQHTFFFTATILEWKKLLRPDKYKDIIVSTLQFLVENKRIRLYAFVIMPNHVHLIWYCFPDQPNNHTQGSLLRFTAQKIKEDLMVNHSAVLKVVGEKNQQRGYVSSGTPTNVKNLLSANNMKQKIILLLLLVAITTL